MNLPSSEGPTQLQKIAETLRKGESPPTVTVRSLLEWFGQQRRGEHVKSTIGGALRRAGLLTEPGFANAYIDGHLTFSLADHGDAHSGSQDGDNRTVSTDTESTKNDASAPSMLIEDPVLRVRMLPAANRRPVTVTRDDPVNKALHLMSKHDYSQLPVTQDMRNVDGMISWRSISLARIRGVECTRVGECMDRTWEEISAEDPLLTAFQKIVDHEAVLVRGDKKMIAGIVTATDLSIMFREQTEPFLLLSEIENQLRRLIIKGKFSAEELGAAKDPEDKGRQVDSVTDLTFGECTRLLEKSENWERLGVGLDHKTFVKELIEVRDIRNDVMHFDPDGLSADELQVLKDVRRLLEWVL